MQTNDTSPKILTVTELTNAIKMQLEGQFPAISLKGELTNLKLQSSGHMYFTLKDEFAQITCVMFRSHVAQIRTPLKIGDQVVVRGALSVYAERGNYQLIVRELVLMGLGELLQKLEQLKIKLQQKGYFDPARKKPLPQFPKIIGVITSPTGAVIQDILHVLTRRLKRFHLVLNPVKVQGEGAADEIAAAIDFMNRHKLADVLIVGRGGGSLEDLMAFNDEKVAEAIFRSTIPIVSAVGHETDVSISDFVADLRAPTPSAAAEIVSSETGELLLSLAKYRRGFDQLIAKIVQQHTLDFNRMKRHNLFTSPTALLGPSMQKLDHLQALLDQLRPEKRIQEQKKKLEQIERAIRSAAVRNIAEAKRRFQIKNFKDLIPQLAQKELQQKKGKLEGLVSHLNSLNPKSLLKKGYSIVFSQKSGSVITSKTDTQAGDPLRILLSDGEIEATRQ